MAKGIDAAGSTSSRQVEQPRSQEVDGGGKQKEGVSEKDNQQAQVDADPNVRNARGESTVDNGKKNQPVNINPAPNQIRTYGTVADAKRDYEEQKGLSEKWPEPANTTFANLLKNDQATEEYKAEMARQVALTPAPKLNLTTLSQLQDPTQKDAVVGALRSAKDAGVLDTRSVFAANAPPKGDPTAVGGLWNAATHDAPGAAPGAEAAETEEAEGSHGVAETVASTGAGLAYSLEKTMEKPLSMLSGADKHLAEDAVRGLGAVFEGVESSMDFKEGMELMQQGRYGEGVAKLAQAGAAATPAVISLMQNAGFIRGMSLLTEKVPGGAMGVGSFVGGLARMVYGKDGNPPDATDRTAGILKMGAGVLQAIPATTVPGTLMSIGVDIADETGVLRTAVEKTGEVLAPAASAISRHQAELDQLQRDNPGVFIMPVGGGA